MSKKQTPLGERLARIKTDTGVPLKDLTVLSTQNDPYRLDTPAHHRNAQWLVDTLNDKNINPSHIHLRGLHYQLVGSDLPAWRGGGVYANTDENWEWLSTKVVKSARWNGYISWEIFNDERNSPPEIYREPGAWPSIDVCVADVSIELPDDLEPRIEVSGQFYRQPYQFVLIAEKAGVSDVLRPLAKKVQGELILPTGEISDTLVYQMLCRAEEDGRPLVVLSLGDFDPAGHQMAVSIGRKVQAMSDSLFDVDARVLAPALTLEQCQAWRLPETPLKNSERRADDWVNRWGWQQTELDAAVALAPDELQESVWRAITPFWDDDLARKNREAREEAEWNAELQLAQHIDHEELARIREIATDQLDGLSEQVAEVNKALRIEVPWLESPDQIDGQAEGSDDWLQSTDDWHESTRRMRRRKNHC